MQLLQCSNDMYYISLITHYHFFIQNIELVLIVGFSMRGNIMTLVTPEIIEGNKMIVEQRYLNTYYLNNTRLLTHCTL